MGNARLYPAANRNRVSEVARQAGVVMDEAEKAEEQEAIHRAAALSHRKPVPKHRGRCLNCRKKSKGAYCDQGCREDAERRDKARIRNGG